MNATIVLPTYREAENLPTLLPALLAAAPVRVLVVDDDSDDGTAAIAEQIGASTGRVELMRRHGVRGLGSAYRVGMRHALEAGADVVLTMDADWSHAPDRLPALLGAIASGADLAIGSRYVDGGGIGPWPWSRRVLSSGARWLARLVLGPVCQDFTSGYRAYRRQTLERVPPESVLCDGYSFLLEMATRVHRAGLRVVEVPIQFTDRRYGNSKLPKVEILRAMATLVRLRRGG